MITVFISNVRDLDLFVLGGQKLELTSDRFDSLFWTLWLNVALLLGNYTIISFISVKLYISIVAKAIGFIRQF